LTEEIESHTLSSHSFHYSITFSLRHFYPMISIRLTRVGKTRAPIYRIVVQPKHRDPWSPAIEILGHYNPRKEPKEIVIKNDRVKYWLSQGAEATDTVWNILVDEKIVEGKKRSTTHISNTHAGKLETKANEAKAESEKPKEEPAKEEPAN